MVNYCVSWLALFLSGIKVRLPLALISVFTAVTVCPGAIPECHPVAAIDSGVTPAPRILYTDIQSGPTSSGEDNLGIYLSIFGVHFWRVGEQPKSDIRVLVGGRPVAAYRYLGPSRGLPGIQQITVQIGWTHTHSTPRHPLPIVVVSRSMRSNSDITFTPNPGQIYFVDNLRGNDSTGISGDIAHPYRRIQTADPGHGGVWPLVKPGDFIVMRSSATPWQDTGVDGYFLRFEKSGLAPAGRAGSGPISVMGYPGEDIFINETYAVSRGGAMAGINGPHGHVVPRLAADRSGEDRSVCEQNPKLSCSQWITIADLRIEGGGNDGPVNLEIGGNHWRVINNTLTASTAHATARAGGVTGDGLDAVILGNTIHSIDSPDPGLENHGIYIDGPGSYRVEYNYIYDVPGGSGFQIYGDETPTGSYLSGNLLFAHNWIDNVAKYCINLSDNSATNITVADNISLQCGMAGFRTNSSFLHGARIYNNTFYAGDTPRDSHYALMVIDSPLQDGALDLKNNLFASYHAIPIMGGDASQSASTSAVRFANNLYPPGEGTHLFDPDALAADPDFVNAEACDFHLNSKSKAIHHGSPDVADVVVDDFDLQPHLAGHAYDIGAYSYTHPPGSSLGATPP